jgi:hypothetical protein
MGSNALGSMVDGAANVAIGVNAFQNDTGNSNSVAIGYFSASSTTFNGSVAIGNASGRGTSISNSVSVGAYSLGGGLNTADTSNCVAIGYSALESVSTGANNVAMGFYALGANTTASDNTAVGHQALD